MGPLAAIIVITLVAGVSALLWWKTSMRLARTNAAHHQLRERHGVLKAESSQWQERRSTLESEVATLQQRYDALSREHQDFDAEEHRMLHFLHDLGETLYADTSRRKLHRRIVKGVTDVVQGRGGALYLYDATRNALVPDAITKHCPPLIRLPEELVSEISRRDSPAIRSFVRLQGVEADSGVLGEVLSTGKPLKLDDLREHPSFADLPDIAGRRLAVMVAPLSYGPKRLGVLAVARPAAKGAFTSHDFDLFKSLAEQSAFALGNSLVHQEVLEKRRIEGDLQRASQIQRVLLPANPPEMSGLTLAATYQPATVVSGDYYDFISVDGGKLGIVIADVSGKGIPAGLVMAICRSFMRVCAPGSQSPTEVLRKINRLIYGDIREDMFVSLTYCVVDPDSGELVMARAGHGPALIFRRQTQSLEVLRPPGLALGVDEGPVFDRATREMTYSLQSGDMLLLYTDGVTEALDAADSEEFGLERLSACFKEGAAAGESPKDLLARIQREVESFATGARQHDDITLVVIRKA